MSAAVPDRSRHSSYMHCITKRNALRIERVSVLWEQNPYEPIERSQAFELTYWTYEDVDCLQLTQESGKDPCENVNEGFGPINREFEYLRYY